MSRRAVSKYGARPAWTAWEAGLGQKLGMPCSDRVRRWEGELGATGDNLYPQAVRS